MNLVSIRYCSVSGRRAGRVFRHATIIFLGAWMLPAGVLGQDVSAPPSKPEASSILDYIHKSWDTLSRAMTDCHSVVDPKLNGAPSVLYLPADVKIPAEVAALKTQCNVDVEPLPKVVTSFGEL